MAIKTIQTSDIRPGEDPHGLPQSPNRTEMYTLFTQVDAQQPTKLLYSLAVKPDGTAFATTDSAGAIWIWNVQGGKLQRVLDASTKPIIGIDWSADGSWLAYGDYDKSVRLWNTATGLPGPVLLGHAQRLVSVAFDPRGTQLAAASA